LAQIICNEDNKDFNQEEVKVTKHHNHFSITGRNSLKLAKRYNSYMENTTVASSNKKWNQALKKQKSEALGYFLDCASELLKKTQTSSMRESVTNSFKETLVTYSTPQHFKGRNSQPIALRPTVHLTSQKESTEMSSQYSSGREMCKKKKVVTFIDCPFERSKYKTPGKKNTSSFAKTKTQKPVLGD